MPVHNPRVLLCVQLACASRPCVQPVRAPHVGTEGSVCSESSEPRTAPGAFQSLLAQVTVLAFPPFAFPLAGCVARHSASLQASESVSVGGVSAVPRHGHVNARESVPVEPLRDSR